VVSSIIYLPTLDVLVGSLYSPPRLHVHNSKTGALLRALGTAGTGTTVGATVQLTTPRWSTAAPWSNTTVIVPDSTAGRVVEVDVVTGFLVKVWFTGMTTPFGVAATTTRIAVGWGSETSVTTKLDMYNLAGVLQWSVGGAYIGDSTNAGVRLGDPGKVQFSQDGSYVLLVEKNSARVTKWSAATGAYLGSVGTGYSVPYDATECWTGAGVGTLVTNALTPGRLDRVSEANTVTSLTVSGSGVTLGVAIVPGVGVVFVGQTTGLHFLSSVAILTHPTSATAYTTSTATFTVALTAASATSSLVYTWTKGGVVVGTNSPSYTYTATTADVVAGPSYPIVCTVTHPTGRAVSNAATLTVARGGTISPTSATSTVGGSTTLFTATLAPGNIVYLYEWTVAGVAVGTNAATYTYTPSAAHTGFTVAVACTITASMGIAVSNTALVTVQVCASWLPALALEHVCEL
jgi:hypothetical protein